MCVPGGAGQSFGVMTDFGAAEVGEGFSSAEPLACRVQQSAWEGESRKRGVGGREKVETSVFAGGTARVHQSAAAAPLGSRGLRGFLRGCRPHKYAAKPWGRNPHVEFVECLEVLQSALTSLIHLFPFLVAFNNHKS